MKKSWKMVVYLFSGVLFAGCAPQALFFNVDVNNKAEKELPLQGRTLAVFSIASQNTLDSLRLGNTAVGLAEKLEEDRSLEKGSVAVYSIPKVEFRGFPSLLNENLPAVDSAYLTGLMLNSGADMLFFVDNLRFGSYTAQRALGSYGSGVSLVIPYYVEINVYDTMEDAVAYHKVERDSIYLQILSSNINDTNFSGIIGEHLPDISRKVGEKLASYLSNQWLTQERMLISYDGDPAWEKAGRLANDFKWEEAIAQWMKLTKSENPKKAAYAAYNIAVGCEILEQFALAEKWIQFAEAKYKFREAAEMRMHLAQINRPVITR